MAKKKVIISFITNAISRVCVHNPQVLYTMPFCPFNLYVWNVDNDSVILLSKIICSESKWHTIFKC